MLRCGDEAFHRGDGGDAGGDASEVVVELDAGLIHLGLQEEVDGGASARDAALVENGDHRDDRRQERDARGEDLRKIACTGYHCPLSAVAGATLVDARLIADLDEELTTHRPVPKGSGPVDARGGDHVWRIVRRTSRIAG